jgi:hypothetical protein
LVYHFYILERIHENFNNASKSDLYKRLKWQMYREAKRKNQEIPLEGLDVISDDLLKEMLAQKKEIDDIKLRFPENTFNQLLKTKLGRLDNLTKKAQDIQAIGSGRGIIGAYKVLYESYTNAADEVKAFTPTGKSDSFVKSFKAAMSGVYGPLYSSAESYKREGWQTIEENQILSDFNFLLSPYKPSGIAIRHDYPNQAVIMDRGGKR